jgi:hypothetical protein
MAEALHQQGHAVSARTVGTLLHKIGYSLQSNRKTQEGSEHLDRDGQFRQIAKTVKQFHKQGQPFISVDAKKKELVGNFKNQGQEWPPSQQPLAVSLHDFPNEALGKALPYGVYDLFMNQGWAVLSCEIASSPQKLRPSKSG